MPTKISLLSATALLFSGPVLAQEPVQPKATYFEAAKITVNARARADGYMRVRMIPENAAPREAMLEVARQMNENDLAAAIAIGLDTVLAPECLADKDNGEHVEIEKRQREAANFSVEITFNASGFAAILEN